MQSHAIAPAPAKTVDNARPLHYNRCAENRVALAQLDRASGYGPEGRGFESLMLRQQKGHRSHGVLFVGVASRDEPLAARKVHAARGSAAAKPTLSPALSPERRMPFEHALPHSLLQHYGEYPSYNKHRKVGALLLGVAYRDELLAARKMHAARGSAAAKPTLSPALSPERGTSFEHALSYSLSQPYGEYPSYKRAPQSRCPFCWRIPSICPRRKQKSRSLYRFSEFYGKTKSNDRQN